MTLAPRHGIAASVEAIGVLDPGSTLVTVESIKTGEDTVVVIDGLLFGDWDEVGTRCDLRLGTWTATGTLLNVLEDNW